MAADPYSVLGVDRNASQEEIKKAYRSKAHRYHPDKKGGDEARFKEVNEAYQVLGDKAKRAQYDRFGHVGANGGFGGQRGTSYQDFSGDFGGFESIFDMFSGFGGTSASQRPQKGEDLHLNVTVAEKDLGRKKVYEYEAFNPCGTCSANGVAPGSKEVACTQCQGQGRVRQTVRTPFGTFAQVVPCTACEARGRTAEKKCTKCGGTGRVKAKRKLEVHLPRKLGHRYQMGFPLGGNAGMNGTPCGDLVVTFEER